MERQREFTSQVAIVGLVTMTAIMRLGFAYLDVMCRREIGISDLYEQLSTTIKFLFRVWNKCQAQIRYENTNEILEFYAPSLRVAPNPNKKGKLKLLKQSLEYVLDKDELLLQNLYKSSDISGTLTPFHTKHFWWRMMI